eukprot:TRINITY_DN2058_c0_g1_i2.p1 TRINITY_DN2058_c0_g1~~TRINITY_DN2058_c0_g1_i2.p1  ORF type:complete len:226 (+),score=20.69 TRINITY_DN2058_c0_g1_i2:315-992(+)
MQICLILMKKTYLEVYRNTNGKKLVGNLPFAVSTALMLKWIRQIPRREGLYAHGRATMALMFQKEVSDRIVAKPSTPEYGRLSVMVQQSCMAKNVYTLPGSVFVPPPKVSAVFTTITPLVEPLAPVPLDSLEFICRQMFGQRRKVLTNSIKTLLGHPQPANLLKASAIDVMKRPDAVTIPEWCALATAYKDWCNETNTKIPLQKYYPDSFLHSPGPEYRAWNSEV